MACQFAVLSFKVKIKIGSHTFELLRRLTPVFILLAFLVFLFFFIFFMFFIFFIIYFFSGSSKVTGTDYNIGG